MPEQIKIDFEHPRENNPHSEQHYFDNLKKFTNQAKFILKLLQNGDVLTTLSVSRDYMIVDLRARISELRRGGVKVDDDFVLDAEGKKTRFKKYFIKKK